MDVPSLEMTLFGGTDEFAVVTKAPLIMPPDYNLRPPRPGAARPQEQSERQQAAENRNKRIQRALEEMNEAEGRKGSPNGKKKSEPRTSVTDPEARVMKMPDGGFRPAYNVHLSTETEARLIVAVAVNNEGTDSRTMVPLAEQIEHRHQIRPTEWLADGGCTSLQNIDAMSKRGCKVFAPLRKRQRPDRKPTDVRRGDSKAVQEWRSRMETEQAKSIYRERGATAEWVNAQFRNQGLIRLLVRGTKKVLAVVLVHALANNMRRSWALG